MLFHRWVTPSIKFAWTHLYIKVLREREKLWASSALPKNTTQCQGQGSNPDRSIQRQAHNLNLEATTEMLSNIASSVLIYYTIMMSLISTFNEFILSNSVIGWQKKFIIRGRTNEEQIYFPANKERTQYKSIEKLQHRQRVEIFSLNFSSASVRISS